MGFVRIMNNSEKMNLLFYRDYNKSYIKTKSWFTLNKSETMQTSKGKKVEQMPINSTNSWKKEFHRLIIYQNQIRRLKYNYYLENLKHNQVNLKEQISRRYNKIEIKKNNRTRENKKTDQKKFKIGQICSKTF
ncbi:unnamed protein product (macronuclear) [Paramecium tetraurelia]|uniref:Uncharacterized protein n=1 Tax=Paramecium tetraurelia TaxID=5888 RepID=A0BWY0_PARTE|nr:uncharacterized protein GSPATT00032899001 [Paramecium tetraurelia]CAK63047.1 unnamed protein product [Paramecium tetraurelia]|eukprot:XP_001430445.1 hypothetical protein (macronuclear) [Paramecium tetraurelia strain d4-2]